MTLTTGQYGVRMNVMDTIRVHFEVYANFMNRVEMTTLTDASVKVTGNTCDGL